MERSCYGGIFQSKYIENKMLFGKKVKRKTVQERVCHTKHKVLTNPTISMERDDIQEVTENF